MSDIRTVLLDLDRGCDLLQADGDLDSDDTLLTAVLHSLFTDREAHESDELPDGAGGDRRGWWGDAYADQAGDRYGSRLWILRREKQLQAALNKAKDIADEALRWLVEDGYATDVLTRAFIPPRPDTGLPRQGVLGLDVTIRRDGQPDWRVNLDVTWSI